MESFKAIFVLLYPLNKICFQKAPSCFVRVLQRFCLLFQAEVVMVVKREWATPTKKHKHRLSNFDDVEEDTGERGCDCCVNCCCFSACVSLNSPQIHHGASVSVSLNGPQIHHDASVSVSI